MGTNLQVKKSQPGAAELEKAVGVARIFQPSPPVIRHDEGDALWGCSE